MTPDLYYFYIAINDKITDREASLCKLNENKNLAFCVINNVCQFDIRGAFDNCSFVSEMFGLRLSTHGSEMRWGQSRFLKSRALPYLASVV